MRGRPARRWIVASELERVRSQSGLNGLEFCHAFSNATDAWLRKIFESATEKMALRGKVALIAVGGYGRGELSPQSDLDLLLLHDGIKDIEDFASQIWYPIWDEGLKLGHAVRTVDQTAKLA